jgi:hypothetical protein
MTKKRATLTFISEPLDELLTHHTASDSYAGIGTNPVRQQ